MGEEAAETVLQRGLQGPTGTWGEGRGRQYSECRDRRWRQVGVGACPGGQAFQDRKRGDNQVQILVQLSIGVADGERFGTRRVKEKDPENS